VTRSRALPDLPGFPLIHSPIFALLEAQGCFCQQAEAARQLHEQGYLLLDLGRERMEHLAGRIRSDLAHCFDLEAWRAGGGQADLRLQDGWQHSAAVAELALLPELHALLEQFWGRSPFAFQTLNFPVGSRQHLHSDAVHFHSEPAGFMCGVWVALEDIHPDAGPLEYVPGSQRFPYLQARDVGYHQAAGVVPDQSIFHATWLAELEASGLRREQFTPRLGQALIWTANLLHGGAPVLDQRLTRWSQVTHYFFEGCRWYTPMLSNWPTGPVAWRRPLNLATGVAVEGIDPPLAEPEPELELEPDRLKTALLAGDFSAAEAELLRLLQPVGSLLPQAWQHWWDRLDASGLAARLLPLLHQLRELDPEQPGLQRWLAAANATVPSGAVDHLFKVAPGCFLAFGWSATAGPIELVACSATGRWSLHLVQAPRLPRPDVARQLQLEGWPSCGFVAEIRLAEAENLAALWLQGAPARVQLADLHQLPYLELVDLLLMHCQPMHTPLRYLPDLLEAPLGHALLAARQPLLRSESWSAQVREQWRFGERAEQAEITVVVPLYRRWDFVLGQVAGFAQDAWFKNGRARLLYVVDDPDLQVEFLGWCSNYLDDECLDVEVLLLQRNLGFAMACNVGVLQAQTQRVCLLNSDVLPIEAGWLDSLCSDLACEPRALLAPLLVYETGLIQHAGMGLSWPEQLDGLPACVHPFKGLSMDQLPAEAFEASPRDVSLLSGAALLFGREHFLALGGFDPVFGRGDFEDLELSLRWRRSLGPVQLELRSRLTHLERQSISREPDRLAQWRQRLNSWMAMQLCDELVAPAR